jgi:hypothetical protein
MVPGSRRDEIARRFRQGEPRGKDVTYTLTYPNGKSEIVLSVPKHNFAWQMGYDVALPIPVTKGTRVNVDAQFSEQPSQSRRYPRRVWRDANVRGDDSPFFRRRP